MLGKDGNTYHACSVCGSLGWAEEGGEVPSCHPLSAPPECCVRRGEPMDTTITFEEFRVLSPDFPDGGEPEQYGD